MTSPTPWPDDAAWDSAGRPLFCHGPGCVARLVQPGRGRPRAYCSVQCRRKANALRELGAYRRLHAPLKTKAEAGRLGGAAKSSNRKQVSR